MKTSLLKFLVLNRENRIPPEFLRECVGASCLRRARLVACVRFSVAERENRDWKAGYGTMPEKIMQVSQAMFQTELDQMVTAKVNELLDAMPDVQADELTGTSRYCLLSDFGERWGVTRSWTCCCVCSLERATYIGCLV